MLVESVGTRMKCDCQTFRSAQTTVDVQDGEDEVTDCCHTRLARHLIHENNTPVLIKPHLIHTGMIESSHQISEVKSGREDTRKFSIVENGAVELVTIFTNQKTNKMTFSCQNSRCKKKLKRTTAKPGITKTCKHISRVTSWLKIDAQNTDADQLEDNTETGHVEVLYSLEIFYRQILSKTIFSKKQQQQNLSSH